MTSVSMPISCLPASCSPEIFSRTRLYIAPSLPAFRGKGKRCYTAGMITLYSWNVNGIRAVVRKEMLQPFIAKETPDILCLQETKAERGQAEIDLKDYVEYWNSAEKKGYSGTAIFSKEEPLNVICGFPDAFAKKFTFADELKRDSANEGRVITAEYPKFY